MKSVLIVVLLALSLLLMPSTADASVSDNTSYAFDEFTLEIDVLPSPEPKPKPSGSGGGGGGEGASAYYTEADLFGTEGSLRIDYKGKVLKPVKATSKDGNLTISISQGTIALGKDGKRLDTFGVVVDKTPPEPPEDSNIIGLPYSFSPSGATFDPPMSLTWNYDPDTLPEDVDEENLVLAFYDGTEWIKLECIVFPGSNTITTLVSHFTTFAIIGTITSPAPVFVAPPVIPKPIEPRPPVWVIPAPEPITLKPIVPPILEPVGIQWRWIILLAIGISLIGTGIFFWARKRQKERVR